jgi:AraC-like DNA-binding protein
MSQSFSTDLIPVSDRQEAWLSNARQICGDCKFHFPKRFPFHGSIEKRKVADLEMTLFSSSPISFSKYPVASLNAESRECIVISQLAGSRRYCQQGKVAVLKIGDTTLIDSGRPWFSDCPGDCARLYLRVPRQLFESRLRLGELPFARRISGESGLGAILFRLFTSLYSEAEALTPQEAAAAIESYLRILTACIGIRTSAAPALGGPSELAARIRRYIAAHLTETTLTPAEIASAMDISVRHVHRVFSNQDLTVAGWIRAERLQRCQNDLRDPRLQSKSITEIAFFWGFNDSAHFSRAFKKQYRVCPRDFRAHVQAGLAIPVDGTTQPNTMRAPWVRQLRAS